MYGEIILDHFKNPRNSGLIENADISGEDLNPLCGDKVNLTLKVDASGIITDFGFRGEGCAISIAATSILGEQLLGKNLREIESLDSETVLEDLGIPISAGRIKCALLGYSCLKKSVTVYRSSQK